MHGKQGAELNGAACKQYGVRAPHFTCVLPPLPPPALLLPAGPSPPPLQENYKDGANVPQDVQDSILAKAREAVAPWPTKARFLRNSTVEAAPLLPRRLDYIYVDARVGGWQAQHMPLPLPMPMRVLLASSATAIKPAGQPHTTTT